MSNKFQSKAKLVKPIQGVAVHKVRECPHSVGNKQIHQIPKDAYSGKSTFTVFEKNRPRRVLIPSRVPREEPAILPKSEFERLLEESRIITDDEQKQLIKAAETLRIQKSKECEARKDMLREISSNPQKIVGTTLGQYESEAKRKTMYLLQRAYELKQEQEDEVKNANRLILAAKCSAIRNAQLVEKELIKQETATEEQRLDMMMEQQRQKELRLEEMKNQKVEQKRRQYIQETQLQKQENELRRLQEIEAIEEENRRMNQALIAIQEEEEENVKKRHDKCIKNAEELRKVNEEMELYKLMEREESKIADMKIAEYMRKKMEADEMKEKEKMEQKKVKEMETLRQQNIMQKQQDMQAQLDELQALRIQEEHEREWRNKERKQALLEKQKEDDLKLARIKQIEDLRRMQALEIARDEKEYAKSIAMQQESHEKYLKEQEKKKTSEDNFRTSILKQITEKERERIKEKREKFEEGEALRLEMEIQKKHIKEIIHNKIQNLKSTGLPEKYIKDVEYHLKL